MIHSRLFAGAAVAALTLACAGAAHAQTYSRLVVFGDSLSDSGNLFAATGGTNPPSPPYFQGRFSNGPVFTELLGFTPLRLAVTGAATGSVNNAFGGARTDAAANPPGMQLQLQGYLARGGTFGSQDLVSVWGGANDIFQGLPGAAASPNPIGTITTVATTAASNIGTLVRQVTSAGAGTVLVGNLPNLAYTPQFLNTPAATLADAASVAFNTALYAQLQAAAANTGSNIILMDVTRAGDFIRANPGALGFTNVTQACLNATTGAVCATPNSFLYWDGVHPTAAGHLFIAALATDYLYYADLSTAYGMVADTGLDHRLQALEQGTGRSEDGELGAGETDVALLVDLQDASFDAHDRMPSADTRSASVRIAAERGLSEQLRIGGMLSYSDADVRAGALDFTARSFGADVYAGWRSQGLFWNLAAGASADEYQDFERVTEVGFVHRAGRGDGWSAGARLQTGVWLTAGTLELSPRVTLNALRTTTSELQEDGPSARYKLDDRTVGGVSGELSLRAHAGLSQGVRVHGEVGYREWLSSDFDDLRVSIVDNTANELSTDADTSEAALLMEAGVSGMFRGFHLGATYRGRASDNSDSHAGLLSVSMRY